ncbi:hypothetical protein FO440_12140 [Mucilaginibacter corticis]|uniref:DUF4097 domain-containing protein n=1 Tax=Mucilaginibacter corticis TaxID=2597670 RepID=A0A556ML36_9SPHI|nr:hypothetical protein [Mucilaginibacter corticis]TSJ40499.1 hypothetical protein FO440_12140 [Mucilaginibacter corticis]
MNKLLIPVLTGAGLCFAQLSGWAQDYKTHVSKQFNFNKGVVAVYNIDGAIKVEGYAGDKVLIEIDETITGKTSQDIEKGKQEFKLGFDEKADSLIAYTAQPYDTRPRPHWDNSDKKRYYYVQLEYTLKVPYNVSLRISTVNHGNVEVHDVAGTLKVNNVNGPITITNAKGTTIANTVNGGITANYLAVPPDESSYRTINGKLEITYPKNFAANLQFKSMNGEFFTDFEDTSFLPTQVIVTKNKNEGGTEYKLNKDTQIKLGAGGKLFKFETLNGNIYIKKQS